MLRNLMSNARHILHCLMFIIVILTFEISSGNGLGISFKRATSKSTATDTYNSSNDSSVTTTLYHDQSGQLFDPIDRYGAPITYLLYLMQFFVLLSLPQCICNFLGLTLYNAFPGRIKLKTSSNSQPHNAFASKPFICVRVVTRGLYPELVRRNVNRNHAMCLESGLENFIVEVVTDKQIELDSDPKIRQIVVPTNYKTSTGALFKARALQYALEDKVSQLNDGDYIVHLDEETLLTQNVINGIINFAMEGKHSFGQGLITYANEEIVNWITTLADSFRVADDMGKLRFQFYMFHRPLFGWKGSFVVTKYLAEKSVSFDHGIDGSIAEDCYFSMIAYKQGYTFNFIEGEMWEKSPFTISDLIQQRKRWMQGIFLVVHSSKVPLINKIFLAISLYSWLAVPLITSNLVIANLFPLPAQTWFNSLASFCGAVTIYMYMFGVMKSFNIKRIGYKRLFVYLIGAIFTLPLNIFIENIAVVWGIFGKKHKFYIVEKQFKPIIDI